MGSGVGGRVSLRSVGLGIVLMFLLLVGIWNSRGVSGDARSPVLGNSSRGVLAGAGGGSGLSADRKSVV